MVLCRIIHQYSTMNQIRLGAGGVLGVIGVIGSEMPPVQCCLRLHGRVLGLANIQIQAAHMGTSEAVCCGRYPHAALIGPCRQQLWGRGDMHRGES